MRQHLNQYVFSPLFWLMSLLVTVLLVLVLSLFTPFGPKAIANIADNSLEELSIKGVSGSVLTGLKIDELLWAEDDVGVLITNIKLHVDKYDIEKKKAYTNKITVGEITIILDETREASDDAPVVVPNFGLPINVDADELHLDSLQIVEKHPDKTSFTQLFHIKGMFLQQASIQDGLLHFGSLQGSPIILDQPLDIKVGNGSLNMNQPHQIKTQGSLSFIHPELGSLNGKIQLDGSLTHYEVLSDLNFEQKNIGKGLVKFSGKGDYTKFDFKSVDINSEYGKAKATGNVKWDPEVRLDFDVNGKELSTKQFFPEYSVTNANAHLKYEASYLDSRYESQLSLLSLEGRLLEEELTVEGKISTKDNLIKAEALDIKIGNNNVIARGIFSEPVNVDLELDAEKLSQIIPELSGAAQGLITVTGTYDNPKIVTELEGKGLSYANINQGKQLLIVNTTLGFEKDVLSVEQGEVVLGKNTLNVNGKASEPFDIKWKVDANKLLELSPQIHGRLKGSGNLFGTAKELSSSFDFIANDIKYDDFQQSSVPILLKGKAKIKNGVLQIEKAIADVGVNNLVASGVVSEPLNMHIQLNAKQLTDISPEIAGRLKGTASIKGSYASPTIMTDLLGDGFSLNGSQFTNSQVKLKGEVSFEKGVPIVRTMNTQIGNNVININGRASSPFNLNWNIDSKNLQQIHSDLKGGLVAKGRLQGTIDKPILNAVGSATNLVINDISLKKATFSANTTGGIYRLRSQLDNFQSGDQKVRSAEVELNGTVDKHTVMANIDHKDAQVNIKANGAWRNPKWEGVVNTLKLADTQAGDWKLKKPARVSISQNGFSLEKLCLGRKRGSACSTASYSDVSGLVAKGKIQKTSLSLFKPFLPEGVSLNGDVTGSYDIQQNNGKPKGIISLKLPKSSFSIKTENGDEHAFSYKNAEVKAHINNRTINTEAKMDIIGKGVFSSKAKINLSPQNGKHTIDGSANFNVPNINFAQRFVPHTRGLRGALKSKLTFSGLLSKPQIKGKASINNGYLRLPEAGTEITNINIDISADKSNRALINGNMKMGKGVLTVKGDMNLNDIAKWQANINIKGNNIRFLNTNEVHATMSPDISLNLTPDIVKIGGKVVIPEADIRLKTLPETSIDESTDTFVIGETKKGEAVQSVKIKPNVIIQIGNKVTMDAFGLAAKLSGDVKVSHNRTDILANGSLRVQEGKFEAYGQDLTINNGRLIFNGSPRLVGMDIRATRRIDEQIVGIHLGGTLLKPKSKIFSDPVLEESESLSYLITGNSLSTASGQESALMLSAVRGLGISGSGSIIQKIGSSFGLDDVNIVTNSDLKKSELALGKRLGSRLYVRYLIGLFDQTQKIAIEYKINKVLSLEAQTTADNFGLDFIYEIETD